MTEAILHFVLEICHSKIELVCCNFFKLFNHQIDQTYSALHLSERSHQPNSFCHIQKIKISVADSITPRGVVLTCTI